MGHAPFHSKEFILPGSLGSQLHCFSADLRPYSPLGRAFTTSFQTRSTRISNRHVLPTLNQSSPAYKFNSGSVQPLFLVYRLLFLKLCSCGCGQTYIQTHTFRKTISVNQVHAHNQPAVWPHKTTFIPVYIVRVELNPERS